MWPLCRKLCCTSSNRLLANGTHDIKVRRGRNSDMQECEDARDSWRKDDIITCNRVSIAIWWKVYRKSFHERVKEMSTRLSDSVIVRPWSKYKSHHHIKDPWILSELGCGEIKSASLQHGLLTEEWGQLVSRDRWETTMNRVIWKIHPRHL